LIAELWRIAGQCDGLRCDMAMLVLPHAFERRAYRQGTEIIVIVSNAQLVTERVTNLTLTSVGNGASSYPWA
jgi:hypothetical protein